MTASSPATSLQRVLDEEPRGSVQSKADKRLRVGFLAQTTKGKQGAAAHIGVEVICRADEKWFQAGVSGGQCPFARAPCTTMSPPTFPSASSAISTVFAPVTASSSTIRTGPGDLKYPSCCLQSNSLYRSIVTFPISGA